MPSVERHLVREEQADEPVPRCGGVAEALQRGRDVGLEVQGRRHDASAAEEADGAVRGLGLQDEQRHGQVGQRDQEGRWSHGVVHDQALQEQERGRGLQPRVRAAGLVIAD